MLILEIRYSMNHLKVLNFFSHEYINRRQFTEVGLLLIILIFVLLLFAESIQCGANKQMHEILNKRTHGK